MAARLYRKYMKLCEMWPVDRSKTGRDLGTFIREQIAKEFRYGEASSIDNIQECERKHESLHRLASNYYGKQYKRYVITTASRLSLEECREVLSTNAQEEQMFSKMSFMEKLKHNMSRD